MATIKFNYKGYRILSIIKSNKKFIEIREITSEGENTIQSFSFTSKDRMEEIIQKAKDWVDKKKKDKIKEVIEKKIGKNEFKNPIIIDDQVEDVQPAE